MVKKNKAKSVTLSFDPAILKIIDEDRGLIKRSTYVDSLLKKQLQPRIKERAQSERA